MANLNNRVQFAKGLKSRYFSNNGNYDSTTFDGFVYFASDTNEVYVDGEAYGIGGTVLETLKSNSYVSIVELRKDSAGNQQLYIKYFDSKGEAKEETVDLFKVSGVNAIEVKHKTVEVGEGEDKTTETTTEYEITLKLNSGDKVLSQDGDGLKTTLSLDYENGSLKLLGKDGAEIDTVDIAELTKDSFVQSGEVTTVKESDKDYTDLAVGTSVLKLVLKTYGEDGSETTLPVFIPTTDLVDSYSEGNGIKFEDVADATGTGKKISVDIVSDSFLKFTEGGALDVNEEVLLDAVKDGVKASDLTVSDTDDRKISDAIATLDSSVNDIEEFVADASQHLEDIDSSISAIKAYTAGDILIGGDTAIEEDEIAPENSIRDALANLNERLNELIGESEDEVYTNAEITERIKNMNENIGLSETGELAEDAFEDILAGQEIGSIVEAIKAQDASLKEYIDSSILAIDHRVNGIVGEEKTDSDGKKYFDVTVTDADINLNPGLDGALTGSTSVHTALSTINDSITWQYFAGDDVTPDETENS